MDFVGHVSGWKKGTVNDTCVNAPYSNNRTMICQYVVYWTHAQGGDSGSPVFQIIDSPKPNDVRLLGIVTARWAGQQNASVYYYSPIGSIYQELGSNMTWDSCDPSQNC